MSKFIVGGLLACFACSSLVRGDNSGPPPSEPQRLEQGDAIGAFYVTKVAGAEDDGVEPGDSLCYRCRYGSSPMVMVFARDTGGKFPELVKTLEAELAAHEESKLRGLVTLMGKDAGKLKDLAKRIAEQANVKRVPVVIAEEFETGPPNYHLPYDVDVTIVVARDSQVVATHSYSGAEIDLATLMSDIKQIVN